MRRNKLWSAISHRPQITSCETRGGLAGEMARAWMPSPEVQAWLREVYSYDPETGVVSKHGAPVGAHVENNGYMRFRIRSSRLGINTLASVHRVAWFFISGEFPPGDVDHVNMNRSDNRACNLRAASRSENMRNVTKCATPTSSRYKGVSMTRHGKWAAEITVDKERIRLGRFWSEKDAAQAYDVAARKHFGEFARVNFPQQRAA